MTNPMVRIYTSVNEYIDREMNAEELKQHKADLAVAKLEADKLEAKAAAKIAAQGKLAALGLTVEDLQALGL